MELTYPILLDGATGTQLQERGYTGEEYAEGWILEHPEVIQKLQREYVAAGSNIIYAPTFGANRLKMAANGIFGKVEEYNSRLVALSREAVDGKALVAGDITSSGKFLVPLGDMEFEELFDIYREQASALEAAGTDLFVIETVMTLSDARAALLAVKSVSKKPVFVSFTCDENGRTVSGTDVTAALTVMQAMGADAFGLNCSVGPEELAKQVGRLRDYARIPLFAKPNAGLPQTVDGKTVYDCPPERFAAALPLLADAGAVMFGGCCGTSPAHIEALRKILPDLTLRERAEKSGIFCATEKDVFVLPELPAPGNAIPCDEDLEDGLEDCEDDMITLSLTDEDGLDCFRDCLFMLDRPLCIRCDDTVLLEKALCLYQGTAIYGGNLPGEAVKTLAKKYGMLL